MSPIELLIDQISAPAQLVLLSLILAPDTEADGDHPLCTSCSGCSNTPSHIFRHCDDPHLVPLRKIMDVCTRGLLDTPLDNLNYDSFTQALCLAAISETKPPRETEECENPEVNHAKNLMDTFRKMCRSKQVQARVIHRDSLSYYRRRPRNK